MKPALFNYYNEVMIDQPTGFWRLNDVPSFPKTLIDSFNRADEDPIASGWLGPLVAGGTQARVASNVLAGSSTGGANISASYWNTLYGPDAGCWATLSTKWTTDSSSVFLYARISNPNTASASGYYAQMYQDTGGVNSYVIVGRLDNGAGTLLNYTNVGNTISAGDQFGLTVVGNVVGGWYKPNGSSDWQLTAVAKDTTYSGVGYLGAGVQEAAVQRLDDFCGSNVVGILDSSGNGFHIPGYFGTVTFQQPGPPTGIPFGMFLTDTTDAFFRAPSTGLADVLSLEVWAKAKDTNFGAEQWILNMGLAGGCEIGLVDDNLDGIANLAMAKSETAVIVESTITIADTNWHHYVGTKNGAAVKLYIDGVECTGTVTNATCVNSGQSVNIGSEGRGYVSFDGTIGPAVAYSTILSQQRVTAHYQAGIATLGVVKPFKKLPKKAMAARP